MNTVIQLRMRTLNDLSTPCAFIAPKLNKCRHTFKGF